MTSALIESCSRAKWRLRHSTAWALEEYTASRERRAREHERPSLSQVDFTDNYLGWDSLEASSAVNNWNFSLPLDFRAVALSNRAHENRTFFCHIRFERKCHADLGNWTWCPGKYNFYFFLSPSLLDLFGLCYAWWNPPRWYLLFSALLRLLFSSSLLSFRLPRMDIAEPVFECGLFCVTINSTIASLTFVWTITFLKWLCYFNCWFM